MKCNIMSESTSSTRKTTTRFFLFYFTIFFLQERVRRFSMPFLFRLQCLKGQFCAIISFNNGFDSIRKWNKEKQSIFWMLGGEGKMKNHVNYISFAVFFFIPTITWIFPLDNLVKKKKFSASDNVVHWKFFIASARKMLKATNN
jgi:hypothetical protein